MPAITFVVDRREAGKTLAAVLKTRYGLSWAQAKRLVENRHVQVSGQVETDVARRLKLGKRVELAAGTIELKGEAKERAATKPKPKPKQSPPTGKSPLKRPLPRPSSPAATGLPSSLLVYADDALVVVNKPAGLTTMRNKEEEAEFGARARKFLPKTLQDMVPGLLGAPNRPVVAVHRIDRDTSGLVVFARTRAAAESLEKQFRKHTVDRRYLALTRGTPAAGRLESVFVRDRGDGRRGSTENAADTEGKKAVTHVKVVEQFQGYALVECRLETGRTHQVRIHLGEAGTPLCGEKVYDRPVNGKPVADASGAARPMLHAVRLGFAHPDNGDPLGWDVPPPDDFAATLARLKRSGQAHG